MVPFGVPPSAWAETRRPGGPALLAAKPLLKVKTRNHTPPAEGWRRVGWFPLDQSLIPVNVTRARKRWNATDAARKATPATTAPNAGPCPPPPCLRSEEHTSELQSPI